MENKIIEITVNDGEAHTVKTEEGKRLFDVLSENGFYTASFCGGNGTCGKCKATVNGVDMLSCRTYAEDKMSVTLNSKARDILSESGIKATEKLSGEPVFALDIGTTTIALAVVDTNEKCVVDVFTANNPQAKYGADVISRIGFCADGGLLKLHTSVIEAVNSLLEKASVKYSVASAREMYVAGNTVMLHLFLNTDCSSMGAAPYTPAFLSGREADGSALGITRTRKIYTLPCFASFVGGDIYAGMYAVKKPEIGKYSLLLDLGTNAEIALFSRDEILCTSAAAGPCFEGANIECGMSALPGAVSEFKIDGGAKTVGNEKAVGICGTGLIDIIAELLRSEEIDETGYLEQEEPYVIAENVYITQKDIREFQVAKSAVKSAAEVLLERAGISFDDIETVYLSGGFSSFINIENAAFCGLIPKELSKKCKAIRNSSLYGAFKYSLDPRELTEKCRYIDLMTDADFSEKFMYNINFD